MTYGRWRSAMAVSGLSVAVAIVFIIIALAIGDNGLLIVMFIYILLPSLLTATTLCFFKPSVTWTVVTVGRSATRNEVMQSYGPYNSGSAARKFVKRWNRIYSGFAVLEYSEKKPRSS